MSTFDGKRRPSWKPTALEVTDGIKPGTSPDSALVVSADTSGGGSKRKLARNDQTKENNKRIKTTPPDPVIRTELRKSTFVHRLAYRTTTHDIVEKSDTVVLGEDADDLASPTDKPVRLLTEFEIFNPSDGFEYQDLGALHHSDSPRSHLEAAGFVSPVFLNEEDAGQEDDLGGETDLYSSQQHLRTSPILQYVMDYRRMDEPLYIETKWAWYCLKTPSENYAHLHVPFYRPHRAAQLVISVSIEGKVTTYEEFRERFVGRWDPILGERIDKQHFMGAAPLIQAVIQELEAHQRERVLSRPFVRELLNSSDSGASSQRPHRRPTPAPMPRSHGMVGSMDLAVLRPENQNPTHVTPFIDSLAQGLFYERLQVVGAPLKQPTRLELKHQQEARREYFLSLWEPCKSKVDNAVHWPPSGRIRDQFWSSVIINGDRYKIGDCVIVQAGHWKTREWRDIPDSEAEIPQDAPIMDYFWVAKIIYMDQQEKSLHVQWFEHSSKTILQGISDPREVFLCNLCGVIPLTKIPILGKAFVHERTRPSASTDFKEFFCQFMYNEEEASFSDIPKLPGLRDGPPENCPACVSSAQVSGEMACNPTRTPSGVSYIGNTYHVDDYVLFRSQAENDPAQIGRVIDIHFPPLKSKKFTEHTIITLQLLGRMANVKGTESVFIEEQEVYMTNEQVTVSLMDLIKPCYVLHAAAADESWLAMSPLHFFAKYHLPSIKSPWNEKVPLTKRKVPVCKHCYRDIQRRIKDLRKFAPPRLRAFDPFAGVGAFGKAMEESGCVEVTHAVEISPSAAITLKKNCPSTIVYNQCSNLVFRHAVKVHANLYEPPLRDLKDNALPPPPRPEDIDCIIAGFPCQPHSTLNMFQKANDRKSHLILNLLAWVDFLKPKFCFFENVKGFLNYNLHATQAGKHRVEGGIRMGGLKFLVHALVSMKYQVRFGLLQAGHYGSPQGRVRFFLVAALTGQPLPLLPQPTHSSIFTESLGMKFDDGLVIKPILTDHGTAPYKYVTIEDAISDLLPWNWEHPRKLNRNAPRKSGTALTVRCDHAKPTCGPDFTKYSAYGSDPLTSYQFKARAGDAGGDVQHYARPLKPEIVERVVSIPVRPNADYRDLKSVHWEWQASNPASALARDGFRPGLYGRLDKDRWFHTTVTNVVPTAKQSYVIHYRDLRVLTVRELARSQGFPDWFVFYAEDGSLKTMHRQIGNAVPWPVGVALGRELHAALFKKWESDRDEATLVSDE